MVALPEDLEHLLHLEFAQRARLLWKVSRHQVMEVPLVDGAEDCREGSSDCRNL